MELQTVEGTDFVSPEMEELLNQQIANEISAAYLYMSISGWAQNLGLEGISKWFSKQSQEEFKHADKVKEFLIESGSDLNLKAIPAPAKDFKDVIQVAELTLQSEMSVTANWRTIGRLAKREDNAATFALVEWFMKEQMEEEDQAIVFVQRARLASDGSGILILDAEMGKD